MAQTSYQSDLPTDAYAATNSVATGSTPAPRPGLNTNQKKVAGITAAALLLGGGVGLVLANQSTNGLSEPISDLAVPPMGEPSQTESTQEPSTGVLPAEFDAAGKVTDSMTFKQAFQAARDEVGVGGVFNWHGRWYNTFEKDEWSSLSLEQRQEYVEMLTGEKLPVKPYHVSTANRSIDQPGQSDEPAAPEPTVIEGYLNNQRIMGLDVDNDGVIDAVVLEGADGYTYRVIDETGNEGLDTLYRFDPLNGELMEIEKLDQPFVLTNDQFGQGLEASMAQEVVDSILESDESATTPAPAAETEPTAVPETLAPETDYPTYIAEASAPDDTYINNGDVHDMDH